MQVCRDGQLLVDLFVNYDCDIDSSSLFERMVHVLVRLAQNPPVVSIVCFLFVVNAWTLISAATAQDVNPPLPHTPKPQTKAKAPALPLPALPRYTVPATRLSVHCGHGQRVQPGSSVEAGGTAGTGAHGRGNVALVQVSGVLLGFPLGRQCSTPLTMQGLSCYSNSVVPSKGS